MSRTPEIQTAWNTYTAAVAALDAEVDIVKRARPRRQQSKTQEDYNRGEIAGLERAIGVLGRLRSKVVES